jgi:ABC-type nitrate/sulfonate/bicarbonate transport system substrate-binding protein
MTTIRNLTMAAVAAAAFTVAGASAQAQDIKVGAASNVGGMIVFVAQGKGFFAKHGLNAKVVVRNTGSALTKSLRAGEIDFAPAAFTNLPVALEKGFKLRGVVGYLGGHFNAPASDGNVGIIARPGTGIKSIKDLKGKKVGVAFGTTGDLYLQEILKKNGMTKNDLKRINVRPPSHVSTLDSGGVDAMVAWEPNVTKALDKVKGSTLVVRGGGHVCFCAGMHGLPEVVYKDRKRTQAFVDAMAEAAHFLRDKKNAKEVSEIGSRYVRGMNADLVARTIKHVIYDARIGGGTADAFKASVKLLIAQKKMKKPYDPAKYLDTSFIDSTIKRHPEWFSDMK